MALFYSSRWFLYKDVFKNDICKAFYAAKPLKLIDMKFNNVYKNV